MILTFQPIAPEIFQQYIDSHQSDHTFMQSRLFGSFRTTLKEEILYYAIRRDNKIAGVALIQKITTRLRTFLHCPHGPFMEADDYLWKYFLEEYYKLGQSMQCDFVRLSPLLSNTELNRDLLQKNHYISSPVHMVNPEKTLIIDIQPSEEDILTQMRKSTRYEIRRAQKMNFNIKEGHNNTDIDTFWNLHQETVARQSFTPFPKHHTEIQSKVFGNNMCFYSVFHENKALSSASVIFDKISAYYHQGASKYSRIPASHALIWHIIRMAKARGCHFFNLWGIVEKESKSHPWFGLSQFKRGFGGTEHNFVHCHERPITLKYWLGNTIDHVRKWSRKYSE